jgi:hypothetical protein
MQPCVDFIDKSPEILSNAFAREMKFDEGRIRALAGLGT